jgi:hypothetical protein
MFDLFLQVAQFFFSACPAAVYVKGLATQVLAQPLSASGYPSYLRMLFAPVNATQQRPRTTNDEGAYKGTVFNNRASGQLFDPEQS